LPLRVRDAHPLMSDKIQIPEPALDPDILEGEVACVAEISDPSEVEVGPGEEIDDEELLRAVTTLVFASPEPLGVARLAVLLDGPRPSRIKKALLEVSRRLGEAGLPLEVREIAGGWRLMTLPEVSETVASLVKARKAETLSPAGLETLAVVVYRQPVTKAEVEAIRGVQCGSMLRNLTDRGLTRVTGRADVPGHPLQYGTTRQFLDRFGLGSLKDLPRDGELLGE
jgi:segregation and condensation protein B